MVCKSFGLLTHGTGLHFDLRRSWLHLLDIDSGKAGRQVSETAHGKVAAR
jgi:hypothetical protein